METNVHSIHVQIDHACMISHFELKQNKLSPLFILVSTYKLAGSQFSLSTSVYRISIFIMFLNYLLEDI